MGDWLQISANIAQVVGLSVLSIITWLIKQFQKNRFFRVCYFVLSIISIITNIVLISLLTNSTSLRSPGSSPYGTPRYYVPPSGISSSQQDATPAALPSIPTTLVPAPKGAKPMAEKLNCKVCKSALGVTIDSCIITDKKMTFSLTLENMNDSGENYIDIHSIEFTLQSFMDDKPHRSYISYKNDSSSSYGIYLSAREQTQVSLTFEFIPYQGIPYKSIVSVSAERLYENGDITSEAFNLMF